MKSRTALDIAQAGPAAADRSPEHKRFRSLLERIEQARERLQAWQAQLPEFARLHGEHVQPVEQRLNRARRAWAFELEQLLLRERLGRAEQATLRRMIVTMSASLLLSQPQADPDLKALHDRHAELGFDEQEARSLQAVRAHIEATTGADLGDEPVGSYEELMARARARLDEQARQQAPEPPRPRHARSAADKRAQAEAAQTTQSVRELYRKLAAVLHPDRIGADVPAAERARRTEQMTQANAAYAAGDLLALLTLQLQLEQVDLARAGQMAATQLRHVNRVLAEQLREIEIDIAEREDTFCRTYGYAPTRRPDPNKLGPFLKDDVQMLLAGDIHLRERRLALQGDLRDVKHALKRIQAELRTMDRLADDGF
jgi:hypothetical protein